jgi:hypothetical protein
MMVGSRDAVTEDAAALNAITRRAGMSGTSVAPFRPR